MRFRLDRAGVAAVARSPHVLSHLGAQARVVAGLVATVAPKRTRRFAKSITTTTAIPTPDGAKVVIYSTDFAAHLVEFGSVNNPAYAPFRRAASMLGLVLRGGGTRP